MIDVVSSKRHIASETTLQQLVRVLRGSKELTQRQLADAAGVSRSAVQRIESGDTSVRLTTVLSVIGALGIKLDLIAKENLDPSAPKPVHLLKMPEDDK